MISVAYQRNSEDANKKRLDYEGSIKVQADKRCNDWAEIVMSRVNGVGGLTAAEAKYHGGCHTKFFYSAMHSFERRNERKM